MIRTSISQTTELLSDDRRADGFGSSHAGLWYASIGWRGVSGGSSDLGGGVELSQHSTRGGDEVMTDEVNRNIKNREDLELVNSLKIL